MRHQRGKLWFTLSDASHVAACLDLRCVENVFIIVTHIDDLDQFAATHAACKIASYRPEPPASAKPKRKKLQHDDGSTAPATEDDAVTKDVEAPKRVDDVPAVPLLNVSLLEFLEDHFVQHFSFDNALAAWRGATRTTPTDPPRCVHA